MPRTDTQATPRTRRAALWRLYAASLLDRYLWSGPASESPRFATREAAAARLREIDGFTSPRPVLPLAELHAGADRDEFLAATDRYRRPVVIRGFGRHMAAVRTWSRESLGERVGDAPCRVYLQDAESRRSSWDRGTELVEVPFDEYLERMKTEPLYLNNATELVHACPELLDDLELQHLRRFTDPSASWDELITTNFFIGARHVFSQLHAALGGNFFLNLVGRKRWVMIEPRYTAHVCPILSRPFQFMKSAYGGTRAHAEFGDGGPSVFDTLPRFEVVLEPGDLLYNAPWWWHEVDNLDDFTVGCAVRHMTPPWRRSPSWSNHFLYTLTSVYPTGRALMYAHHAYQALTGGRGPTTRELLQERQLAALERGLGRAR